MRLFGIDLHISVIADLKHIFSRLGHTVDDWCLSNHHAIMNRKKDSVPMLCRGDWRTDFFRRKPWKEFRRTYPELERYDAFVCCYPPAFSLLYAEFDKPIIIDIPIRYEYPFHHDRKSWEGFNRYIRDGVDSGKIYLVANSYYEKLYTEAYLEREVRWIPSLCEYTGMNYDPGRKAWLYYCKTEMPEFRGTDIFWKKNLLPFGHPWSALTEFLGIVHFPYNCSTMSLFEQYAAAIPLFVPGMDFLIDLYVRGAPVLDELSWLTVFGLPPGSPVSYKADHDPNDYRDIEGLRRWLKYCDFYYPEALGEITYFDSIPDLHEKIRTADYPRISLRMRNHNASRRRQIYASWDNLLKTVAGVGPGSGG